MSVNRVVSLAAVFSLGFVMQAAANPQAAQGAATKANPRMKQAYRLIAQKKDAQAIAALKNVLKKDPTNQAALAELGYAYLRQGDKNLARKNFELALEQDPQNKNLLKELAFLDLQEEKLEEAAGRFETVRGLDNEDYFTALQLGYIYQRLGKKEEARDAFQSALASPDAKIRDSAETALKKP